MTKIEAVRHTIDKTKELVDSISKLNEAFGVDELPFFIKLSDVHDAASDMVYFLEVFSYRLGKELEKLET